MDLSRGLFDIGLLGLLLVVGLGWTAILVECINALLQDRANGREYRKILAYNAKIEEIESRPGGLLTEEEVKAGWHYCPTFDGLLTQGEILGGDSCLCDKV